MNFVSYFIADKYLKNYKNKNLYYTKLGIILALSIYILISSLIEGFNKEIKENLLQTIPNISYTAKYGELLNTEKYINDIKLNKNIEHINSYNNLFALLKKNKKEINIKGVSNLNKNIVDKSCIDNFNIPNGICLTKKQAKDLNINKDEFIEIMYYEKNNLKIKKLKYIGNIKIESSFHNKLMITNQKNINSIKSKGIEIYLKNPFKYQSTIKETIFKINEVVYINHWGKELEYIYKDFKLIKILSLFVLFFIILLSIINLIFNIIIQLKDKEKDLITLRNMGFSKNKIKKIFLIQSIIIYFKSALIGIVVGLLSMKGLEYLSSKSQHEFETYIFNSIPFNINYMDITITTTIVGLIYIFFTYLYLKKIKII